MANPEHLAILDKGVEAWNRWQAENRDVLPDLGGANLYSYVGNNPCTFVDPLGLVRCQLAQFTSPITRGPQTFAAADLNHAVRVAYAEETGGNLPPIRRPVRAPGGGRRFETTQVDPATLALEARAIADVIFNRVGEADFGYLDGLRDARGRPRGPTLAEVLTPREFTAIGNFRYQAARLGTVEDTGANCADYQRAFDAVQAAATNGPLYPTFRFFVAVQQPRGPRQPDFIRPLVQGVETNLANHDFSHRDFGRRRGR